ncbi:hypothetical protein N9O08_01595 [Alphaproteobacteria bacterium]|nr:hypothetical protein [Alphaproteobacteria bacterium]
MIALIKNNQHFSHNYVIMNYDTSNELTSIIKSASHKNGIKSVDAEICGLDWYAKRSSNPISYNFYKVSDTYINLSIKALDKIKIPGNSTYSNYKRLIPIVIKHYCDVWGKGSDIRAMNALHGDLSLVGNVLFKNSETPVFIDWEHFKENAAPIGFDALNCILELLYYEDLNNLNLLHSNLKHVSEMINLLDQKKCLNDIFRFSPLLKITNFMKKNANLWGSQVSKFPVLKFSKDQVSYIDKHLNKFLNETI